MRRFRERGIYLAPNGLSFVASSERETTSDGRHIFSRLGNRLSCFLFGRYEWAFHGLPEYEVGIAGNVFLLDKDSDALRKAWSIDQLVDTGATAGAH